MDLNQASEFAPETSPPAVLWPARTQLGPERFIFGNEVVEAHRLARRSDDGRDCRRMLPAEPVDEQAFEISERHSTVDGATCGEGHDERVGPAGKSFGPLGCAFDSRHALLEAGDATGFGATGLRRRRRLLWRRVHHDRLRSQDRLRFCRSGDTDEARRAWIVSETPGGRARAD